MNFAKFLGALFLIQLLCFEAVNASHIRAGEVIARRTSNLTFEYEFTFIGYRDTDTGIEFGGGDFDFGDGTVISGDFLRGWAIGLSLGPVFCSGLSARKSKRVSTSIRGFTFSPFRRATLCLSN